MMLLTIKFQYLDPRATTVAELCSATFFSSKLVVRRQEMQEVSLIMTIYRTKCNKISYQTLVAFSFLEHKSTIGQDHCNKNSTNKVERPPYRS